MAVLNNHFKRNNTSHTCKDTNYWTLNYSPVEGRIIKNLGLVSGVNYGTGTESDRHSLNIYSTNHSATSTEGTICKVYSYDDIKKLVNITGSEYLYKNEYLSYPVFDDSEDTNITRGGYLSDQLYNTIHYPSVSDIPYPTINRTTKIKTIGHKVSIVVRGNPFGSKLEDKEEVAVETLREEISERDLRKYLRYGFILVQANSGKTYQIFRNNWHTKVWKGGKLVEEVCVRLSYSFKVPSTDNVIAFKRMIEADEEGFRKCGNVYKMEKKAA